jgi:uncharacterized metal-binding protein YceD (DUF177 family)
MIGGGKEKLCIVYSFDMKLRISTIPPQGLHLSHTISANALNDRMKEGRDNGAYFIEDPSFDLSVRKHPSGAEIKGEITAKYRQPCGRCVQEVIRTATTPLHYILKPRPERNEAEDDLGIAYYDADHIELDELMQEEVVLHLDLFWSPPLDEHGACIECHRDSTSSSISSKGRTFGDLLKTVQKRSN